MMIYNIHLPITSFYNSVQLTKIQVVMPSHMWNVGIVAHLVFDVGKKAFYNYFYLGLNGVTRY